MANYNWRLKTDPPNCQLKSLSITEMYQHSMRGVIAVTKLSIHGSGKANGWQSCYT